MQKRLDFFASKTTDFIEVDKTKTYID
jgi:hypothetical protein